MVSTRVSKKTSGQLCEVRVPTSVLVGENFTVRYEDAHFLLTCTVKGGQMMRFVVPEHFQVVLPYVQTGQDFFVDLDGERYTMTCPRNVRPGQMVRFRRPLNKSEFIKVQHIQLPYGTHWKRIVNKHYQFQWKPSNTNTNNNDLQHRFAMVRHLLYFKNDFYYGHAEGKLQLQRPETLTTPSRVRGNHREIVATASELYTFHKTNCFLTKTRWCRSVCQNITRDTTLGIMQFSIVRNAPHVLDRAVDSVMSLNNVDLRKVWCVEFVGGGGGDGISSPSDSTTDKEQWFLDASRAALQHTGLFVRTEYGTYDINSLSSQNVVDYLVYYRFFGRLLGRALFDGLKIAGRLDGYLLKHILGLPLTIQDFETIDNKWKEGFLIILDAVQGGRDLESLGLTFCVEGAEGKTIPLKDKGETIKVTNENYQEFFELLFDYKLLRPVNKQLTQILLGIFEIVPEQLLSVFDENELDRLLSGGQDTKEGSGKPNVRLDVARSLSVARETTYSP